MEKIKEGVQTRSNDNILISYSAGDPEHENWFIYEYLTGRKVLVEIHPDSGKVTFLREL